MFKSTENEYPHVMVSKAEGKKGQRCRKLPTTSPRALVRVQVEFEDGTRMVVNARNLRRDKNFIDASEKSERKLTPNGQRAEGE